MTRSEFIKNSVAVGLSLPFLSMLTSCGRTNILNPNFEANFQGKVLIIGAGSAGITAGYLLARNNIDFQILEASADFGGRMKRADNFVDFPIDLGAEWIHDEPEILSELISDSTVNANIDLIKYRPQTHHVWNGNSLKKHNWTRNFYAEYKFKSTTWYGFFEKFMMPDIGDKLLLDSPVSEIDYSADKVRVTTEGGNVFEADKVLVTTPIKILQDELIEFVPALSESKKSAIDSVLMPNGIKAFIEFKEKFYPDLLSFGSIVEAFTSDNQIFYDAAFRKDATRNVLGLFVVGSFADQYTELESDQAVIDSIMKQLDEIFDGKASENYVQSIVQNWSKEPYIRGSYSYEFDGDRTSIMQTIAEPIDQKIFFAGEALSDENQATVHGAAQTAYVAVEELLKA